MKNIINDHLLNDTNDDDDFFFFNVMFDRDSEPILGDGTHRSHVNICMTSKRFLRNLEQDGVHHWDCTYKITIHGYRLLIYLLVICLK